MKMKKIITLILFTSIILSNINNLYAEYNQDNTISKAILVETYVKKHIIRINEFIEKYNIKNSQYLENDIKELKESIVALEKIKNAEINSQKSEDIINAIVKRIKVINENLKANLNKEKLIFQFNLKKKKITYTKLWIKISKKIDAINIKIAKTIIKIDKTDVLKESRMRKHLIRLNKESKKLKSFWNINFKSEKEIKDSFVRILNNIKREVNKMKESLK